MYYYVYLLRSVEHPQEIYIGYTTNLKQRLKTHNTGGSTHTKKYKPWELVTCITFTEKEKATQFEKYLKSHAGRAFAQKRLW